MSAPGESVWLHRFAVLTACGTFLLIIAGGLVVGNEAGLAVPDWPLSYGMLMPPMEGGVFYEHGHRMIATSVGFLMTVLAIWLWRREPRRWVRRLGIVALGAVITQGILGGLTVIYLLPTPISVSHACLAQLFFCMTLSLALFTSRGWNSPMEPAEDREAPQFRHLAVAATVAIFIQLALGAALRHNGLGIAPHLIGAGIVAVLILWVAHRAFWKLSGQGTLVRLALAAGALMLLQLTLGVGSYWIRLVTQDAVQPQLSTVWITTAHVAVGALLLGVSLLLTLQSYRRLTLSGSTLPVPKTLEETLA
ncbi:MAG: COX15/CtaA family protein [Acidobacteria bacterium]|nr:COX15/CtaA family protein [Acidobacteriota bacterium]